MELFENWLVIWFYDSHLEIFHHSNFLSLNEMLKSSDRELEFNLFAPRMPLNASPLHILLEVKNSSQKVDRELKISKHFLCDCKRRDKKRGGKACKHLNVADVKPNSLKVKAESATHIEIIIRYELIGCHEIIFFVMWVNLSGKMFFDVKFLFCRVLKIFRFS